MKKNSFTIMTIHETCFILENCNELEEGGEAVSESQVVNWFSSLLASSAINVVTKQYALLSMAKLSTR